MAWRLGTSVVCGGLIVLAFSSCGGDNLSGELLAESRVLLERQFDSIEVDVADDDVDCVARRLDVDDAQRLGASPLESDVAVAVAEAIVDCAGVDAVASSALAALDSGAASASLVCVANRLGPALVVDFLAARLAGLVAERTAGDLDVVTAFALCLEPEELLRQAG